MARTIVFTVKGKRYPMPASLTFGDAHLLRKMDINLAALGRAVEEGDTSILADPFVMGGMLLVAMKHAGERVGPNSLYDLDITSVEVELEGEEDEEDEEAPLVAEGKTPKKKKARSGATTPADSGLPD